MKNINYKDYKEYYIEGKDIKDESGEIYDIVSVIDVFSDVNEIKLDSLDTLDENAIPQNNPIPYRKVNDIIYLSCLLKPRNSALANINGEIGVIKCKVLETFYGTTKLKNLTKF